MPDMDWLKPIEERLSILEATRALSADGPTTTVDMLEADARKLIAAVRFAEKALVDCWPSYLVCHGSAGRAGMSLVHLRSGEVEDRTA